jgi:RHS repeat-associated protein
LNRISTAATQATTGTYAWGLQFGYDIWGNLLSATVTQGSAPMLSVGVNTKNQINNTGFVYDAAGNLTADGTFTFQWDAESRIKSLNGGAVSYTYDGDGKRVKKSNGKLYWYSLGLDPLAESDLSGNLTDEYIFFGGKRIARRTVSSGAINYYFADHLGSSRVVTNATGTVLDDSDFYPFGGERVVTSSSGNNYKFTGKERDAESNLDYFLARYYSSQFGRLLSPDEFTGGPVDAFSASDPLPPGPLPYATITNPQSLNKYTYTWNNPLRYTDPDGHFVDTLLDIAFIAHDIYELAKNPNRENATALALDVAGAAIPFATGLGKGFKAAKALERAKQVERAEELGSKIGSVFRKVDNIIEKNLDAKTIEAAKRELKGETVALRPDGKPFDHVRKVQEAMQGLKNQIGELNKLLSDPNLSEKARKAVEGRLSKASKKLDEVEKQLK